MYWVFSKSVSYICFQIHLLKNHLNHFSGMELTEFQQFKPILRVLCRNDWIPKFNKVLLKRLSFTVAEKFDLKRKTCVLKAMMKSSVSLKNNAKCCITGEERRIKQEKKKEWRTLCISRIQLIKISDPIWVYVLLCLVSCQSNWCSQGIW